MGLCDELSLADLEEMRPYIDIDEYEIQLIKIIENPINSRKSKIIEDLKEQISKIKAETPNRLIGLVLFNDLVQIHGDTMTYNLPLDQKNLNNEETIKELVIANAKNLVKYSISSSE